MSPLDPSFRTHAQLARDVYTWIADWDPSSVDDACSPGDYLKAEDDEIEGFKTRLSDRLAPVGTRGGGEGANDDWEIGDTLAQWWRPNFETFMYPFIPPHVTRPKECKKLYFIQLPRSSEHAPVCLTVEE